MGLSDATMSMVDPLACCYAREGAIALAFLLYSFCSCIGSLV